MGVSGDRRGEGALDECREDLGELLADLAGELKMPLRGMVLTDWEEEEELELRQNLSRPESVTPRRLRYAAWRPRPTRLVRLEEGAADGRVGEEDDSDPLEEGELLPEAGVLGIAGVAVL